MTDSPQGFFFEFPCDWRCRIELDLSGIHDQFTHRQMVAATIDCHLAVHAGEQVRAEFSVVNTRAGVGAR